MKIIFKSLILSLLLFFTVLPVFSQINIEGIVKTMKKAPVGFVTISLLNAERLVVRSSVSDITGHFVIRSVPAGTYTIRLIAIGFVNKEMRLDITPGQQAKQYEFELEEDIKALKEVQITAKRPFYEQKMDRLIINVQQSPVMASGTALEALEKSPGIDLNKQKGSIALNGKGEVLIMINGKVSYQPMDAIMRMLGGMNANNVQKIELITSPPAEYDAAGNGGIINIVLIKNENMGFNGSYGFNLGYGTKEKAGANFDINYGGKKFNAYGSLSYYHDRTAQTFTNDREVLTDSGANSRSLISNRKPVSNNFNSRLGFDIYIDSSTTVGVAVSGYSNLWDMKAYNTSGVKDNGLLSSSVSIDNSEKNHWQNVSGNIYLNKKFSRGEELNFDVDYLRYLNNDPTDYLNNYYDASGQNTSMERVSVTKRTPVKIGIVKIDYIKTLNGSIKLKSGLKGSLSNLSNDVMAKTFKNDISAIDSNLTNSSLFHENIGAAYSELNIEFNKSTHLNLGLRYEYSKTTLESISGDIKELDRRAGNLFPTLFFAKNLSQHSTLQVSYGRRITRPSYNNLAPYVIFLDPTTYFYGNAAVKPSISSNFKLDYIYHKYIISFQYNHSANAINSYQATLNPQTNQEIFTAVNLKFLNSYSIIAALPGTFTNWWETKLNLMAVRQELQSAQLVNNISLDQYYFKINNTQSFTLFNSYNLDIVGWYRSRLLAGISRVAPMGTVDLGIQRQIGKNVFRLSYTDIFRTNLEKDYTNSPVNNLNILETYRFEPRIVKLSISRKFGSSKAKSREREDGAEDIKKRVN